MPLRKFSCFLLFVVTIGAFAQNIELSPVSEISVLTCGSGDEIYSKFGHSAIRVEDSTLGIDAVYNYGTFDFTTPNFILKFARGKLNYLLSRQSFPYFLKDYEMENRWVKSQKLELSLPERQILFNFLETNYLPENRDYKYDFFYNNCVTKIWDVLFDVYGPKLAFDPNYLDERYTHRQLIHQKVNVNSWLGFGIDLALGSVIDDIATPKEHMFLPDYTMLQLEHSTLASEPLAMDTEILFEARPVQERNTFFASPVFWLTVVLLIILVLTYRDFKNNTRRRWLDFIVFFGTGATGLLILFLWFFTDHTATAGNFNFLWAFPLNLIIAFIVGLKIGPNWIAKYVLFLAILLFSCTVLWLLNVQVFSPVAIPIWLALAVRYLFLYWSYKTPKLT